MKVLLVVLLSSVAYFCQGQFTGGSGDGFSSLEVDVNVSGLTDEISLFYMYPTVCNTGQKINVTHLQTVYLVDVLGHRIEIDTVGDQFFTLPLGLAKGSYLVVVQYNNSIFMEKIVLFT